MMKNIALVCCGTAAVSVSLYLYKLFRYYIDKAALNSSIKATNTIEPLLYDVIFFTNESALCRDHLYNDRVSCEKEHCPVKYLRRIKGYLDSATDTLYVCIFTITCTYLREAIIAAKARGVTVKIITDIEALSNTRTKVLSYKLEDIETRYLQNKNDTILMHHKFVVVDCRIVITGSTNWTMSAFFGNFENMIVTNNPEVVEKYKQEFIKLWEELPKNELQVSYTHGARNRYIELMLQQF